MTAEKDDALQDLETYLDGRINREQYDPNQDPEERRLLRIQYRTLHDKTLENRRELISQNGDGLYRAITKSNVLFKDVKQTQEAILDSRFLVLASDLNSQKTQTVKIGNDNEVNIDDFVSKVVTAANEGEQHDDQLDWKHLGEIANMYGKRAHSMDFLLGPLSVQRKEIKRSSNTRVTKNKADLVVPTQLKQGDIKKQENETSNNVNHIYKILEAKGPINYFKFVTNPESFSQTVENIFYVSFLARSGVAGIDVSSGQPILGTRQQPDKYPDQVFDKKQIIMGIDIRDWKDIINTYNITTSCIPTRVSKEVVANKDGWY